MDVVAYADSGGNDISVGGEGSEGSDGRVDGSGISGTSGIVGSASTMAVGMGKSCAVRKDVPCVSFAATAEVWYI